MNTTPQPIVVVGGTGKTGRRVASNLKARGLPVRAASRSGPTRFDWDDRGTWGPTLDGAGALYVAPPFGPELDAYVAALADAAAASGVSRLVLLTGSRPDLPDEALPAYSRAERVAERAVRESGLAWTIVRPNWFMQNFSEDFLLEGVLAGEVRAPVGGAALPFTDADDIAAVAVAALTDGGHEGQTYDLSGPRALTFADAAVEIGRATGRAVRYVPITPDEFAAELDGLPGPIASGMCDLFAMASQGRYGRVYDGVARVLGRPPRDFAQYARDAAVGGAWDR